VPTPENDHTTGAELAEALSWQGIPAHEAIRPETDSSIGAALLAAAAKTGATLIVMGAYTHSRWRHSFLGGVTMHVLSEAAIPVVMSHQRRYGLSKGVVSRISSSGPTRVSASSTSTRAARPRECCALT